MRILSTSPRPPLRLDRIYDNINFHAPHNSARLHPTRSRCIALLSWLVSLLSITTILCLNLGGVSWPLANQDNPISRLGNPGFELLQWFFDGPPPSASIANFYHYRLSLNRLCAINPTRQRGYGSCYNSGPLGSFRFSQHSPDTYIAHERAYDGVVGRVDLFTPFLFYLLAAACAASCVLLLPLCIVSPGAGGAAKRDAGLRTRAATAMFGQALCLGIASGSLTFAVLRLAKWMQWIPQISHIWAGTAPLALTWTSTIASILAALAMLDDAALARRVLRERETRGDTRGRSLGWADDGREDGEDDGWDRTPHSAVEAAESAWSVRSPRKRLGHSATLSAGSGDVEAGSLRSLDLDERPKLG